MTPAHVNYLLLTLKNNGRDNSFFAFILFHQIHGSLTKKNSLHSRENSYYLLHVHLTGTILRVFVCLGRGEGVFI